MRNPKRFIALILVVMMAFGGVMMNVSAAKLTDADQYTTKGALTGVDLAYAIDILQQLGVVRGVSEVLDEDGKIESYVFDGESLVTRQQFALFTARIATALPSRFVIDPDEDVKTNTTFKDLIDKTYTLAIDHCFNEGYILGRDEESTIFDPIGNITFAEAVTMLTRALGYTGLVYPTGFITKASDPDVRLIGEYADFPMANVALNTPISRGQMAMLLWNFLLSERYQLEMVYNGEKKDWDTVRIGRPVLETFGITRTVGYVTAVPNWSANLTVFGLYKTYTTDAKISLAGQALTSANTPFVVYTDICISPASVLPEYNVVGDFVGYASSAKPILTTMDKVGLSEYKADPLYLLGLKVTVYQDTRVNPEFNINIPAIVNGTKYEIDIEEAEGANNPDAANAVTALSLPFPPLGEEAVVDWGNFLARKIPNLYMFGEGDAVLSGIDTAAAEANTIYLAQKANNKTNYRLELVDNGAIYDGTPEYFYIFRPFKVGVVFVDDTGAKRFTTEVKSVDKVDANRPILHAANFKDEEIESVDAAKGYLYTYYGANLDIYAELDEKTEAVATAANYTAGRVDFSLAAGNLSVLFNSSLKAQGAWGGVQSVDAFNGITRKDIDNKGVYTIYYDGAAALLARKTGGGELYKKSEYAVVMSISNTREITLRDPNDPTHRIGQAYRAVVFNAQTGKTETIAIWKIDDKEDDFEKTDPTLLTDIVGLPIKLAFAGAGNDYWNVYTEESKNFVYVPLDDDPNMEYKAANKAITANLEDTIRRITVAEAAANANHLTFAGNTATAYINTNTIIVVYSEVGNKVTRLAVTKDNLAQLKDLIGDGYAKNIALVGLGGKEGKTGVAGYIFLKTASNVTAASTNKYAISLGTTDVYYGGYSFGSVKQMDGSVLNVYAETGADLNKGNVVLLGSNTVEYDGVTYTAVKYTDNKLNISTVAGFDGIATKTSLRNVDPPVVDTVLFEQTGIVTDYVDGARITIAALPGTAEYNYLEEFKGELRVFMKYESTKAAAATADTPAIDAVEAFTDVWFDGAANQQFITLNQAQYYNLKNTAKDVYAVVYSVDDGAGVKNAVGIALVIDYTNRAETTAAALFALFK